MRAKILPMNERQHFLKGSPKVLSSNAISERRRRRKGGMECTKNAYAYFQVRSSHNPVAVEIRVVILKALSCSGR
jgi:hypothetical protein